MIRKLSFAVLAICAAAFIARPAQCIAETTATNAFKNTTIETYDYPRIAPGDQNYKLKANDQDVFVYRTSAGPFAAFSCDGPVNIEIELPRGSRNISISPKKLGIIPEIEGNVLRFQIPGPALFAVMQNEYPLMYVYANPLERNKPDPSDPGVHYFKAGQVYEIGDFQLGTNETLYIEGGAIVRGAIVASHAENVRIAGHGVLDGGYFAPGQRRRSIIYEACRNSVIEDIIMIEPTTWMIVLGNSEHINVRNVKQLGFVSTSDGVDIVGSRHIRIENSFFRNGDDCIAIKSFDMSRYERFASHDYSADVYDIEVKGCIVLANIGGTAFEFGHELTTNSVRDVRFIDCDVLGVHDHGGVFGIHNADRAVISDILYDGIRVEHYYNKLIDMRIIKSRYHRDESRGQVRNITFRNIDVTVSQYNPGYSISLIGGYDENHTIENVVFDNFRLNGIKVLNADQLDLFIKQASGIVFK